MMSGLAIEKKTFYEAHLETPRFPSVQIRPIALFLWVQLVIFAQPGMKVEQVFLQSALHKFYFS